MTLHGYMTIFRVKVDSNNLRAFRIIRYAIRYTQFSMLHFVWKVLICGWPSPITYDMLQITIRITCYEFAKPTICYEFTKLAICYKFAKRTIQYVTDCI